MCRGVTSFAELTLFPSDACAGPQSALVTAGRDAADIAGLFNVMAIGALVVWAAVVVIAIYTIRVRESHSHPSARSGWPRAESRGQRAASLLIIGGGVVVPTIDPPVLDDEALVLRGAGQYETACLPCHGGPGRRVPPVMAAMTPPPPELSDRLFRWAPEQLFSIVKHGIKFTGMPAWPAQQRDDEVWAMVAFLRRMPQLDAAAYRRLAYGQPGAPSDAPSAERRASVATIGSA